MSTDPTPLPLASDALKANLQETAAAVSIDPAYAPLQEIVSRFQGLSTKLETLLYEISHPYRNWKLILPDLRAFVLKNLNHYRDHEQGPEAFTLFTGIFVFEFLFDFIVENVVIRTTHAYAFANTYEPLTLWAGEVHQFPIYESILVAFVGCVFTWMRMEAEDHPEGLSPIESGLVHWRPELQGWVRNFAVLGFCMVSLCFVYHLPFNWLGMIGDSVADMPSYLLPA